MDAHVFYQEKNLPAGDIGDAGSIPGGGDPLGKEMATHSNILLWETPQTEEPGKLQSVGLQEGQTQLSDSNNNSFERIIIESIQSSVICETN